MTWMRTIGQALVLLAACNAGAQGNPAGSSGWTAHPLAFEPISIASDHAMFWVCGTKEGIASSPDGVVWTMRHVGISAASPTLLGIGFASDHFGYAYGTGGVLLTTTDGGTSWTENRIGSDAILQASFADEGHGIFRTRSALFYVDGGEPKPIPLPRDTPANFRETVNPVALTPMSMSILLSEGWRSRAAFVFTNDGGKSWEFYEPPHMQPNGQLARDGSYWSYGTETVGFDANGEGGLGVPFLMRSTDGRNWTRTAADMHACHWEGCDLCRIDGCLASSDRVVNAYGTAAVNETFPAGHLTAEWSAVQNTICTVDGSVFCATLTKVPFIDKPESIGPTPSAQRVPPIGTKESSGMLRCVRCSLDPLIVDASKSGVFAIKISLTVAADGVPRDISVNGAPSAAIQERIQRQVATWIFEPVLKDGQPVNAKTTMQTRIRVMKSR